MSIPQTAAKVATMPGFTAGAQDHRSSKIDEGERVARKTGLSRVTGNIRINREKTPTRDKFFDANKGSGIPQKDPLRKI